MIKSCGAPSNWNPDKDGPCETLPTISVNLDGRVVHASFWQPEPHELEQLNRGGAIELHILQPVHPVVSLRVNAWPGSAASVEENEDAEFARRYGSATNCEDVARVLSHRLRQMDKRTKAANARADRMEAELRALTPPPQTNVGVHDFRPNAPGVVGSDLCTVCGKDYGDHPPVPHVAISEGDAP